MVKRFVAALAVLVLAASVAVAAPVAGKVAAIDGKKVSVTVTGEKATWMKKGAPVKWKGGVGRIVEIKDDTLTVNSKNAAALKVGDELALEKGPAELSGC
jgi:ABC-type transporter Mla subunit MlaD